MSGVELALAFLSGAVLGILLDRWLLPPLVDPWIDRMCRPVHGAAEHVGIRSWTLTWTVRRGALTGCEGIAAARSIQFSSAPSGWLRDLGFTATTDPDMTVGATFVTDAVVVRPTYHWHDEYADVSIATRWTPEPAPYWAQVHLNELLERAAGMERTYNGVVRDSRALEDVFPRAAALLREAAPEQLAGRNLKLLDEIIAKRPHRGVPGLDFPVTKPWASSQEGLWFTTDFRSGARPSLPRWSVRARSTGLSVSRPKPGASPRTTSVRASSPPTGRSWGRTSRASVVEQALQDWDAQI